jgi:putative Mg2+ transporter-C (MgtC) family protein
MRQDFAHILVCIGSAGIMLLSMYGFAEFVNEINVRTDPARLAAQVISGIGFLGAGAIMRTGSNVSGLTTAASIWVVAAIGLCAGAGFYYCALLATGIVLISLFLLNKWEKRMLSHRRNYDLEIKIADRFGCLGDIAAGLEQRGVQLKNVLIKHDEAGPSGEQAGIWLKITVRTPSMNKLIEAMQHISVLNGVISVQSDRMPGARAEEARELKSQITAGS